MVAIVTAMHLHCRGVACADQEAVLKDHSSGGMSDADNCNSCQADVTVLPAAVWECRKAYPTSNAAVDLLS